MSHYTELETTYKNQDILIAALMDMGWTRDQIEVHDVPKQLDGFSPSEIVGVTATLIVPKRFVGDFSNDIGFVRGPTGAFMALLSDFDRGAGTYAKHVTPGIPAVKGSVGHLGLTWQAKLKQRYAYRMLRSSAAQQGLALMRDSTATVQAGR